MSKIEVTHGAASNITINSWTLEVASDANFTTIISTLTPVFTASATTTINRPAGADWSNCYYRFTYNVSVSGSSNRYLLFSEAKFYKESGGDTPTSYTVTFDADDGTFVGSTDFPNASNTVAAGTYTLPSAERSGFTFDGWLATGSTTPVSGSYTVSDDVDFTASYSENTTPTPGGNLVIDFESAASTYTDWTFTNMTSQQTATITAHAGTYYGTTGGKATASITTNTPIATPGSLTCYVSKQSTNTTASTWYIQVSSDGSTWTDVETTSATDMAKGVWKGFTADLSSYTNVYVRVYYSGSNAIRNIDDLTLTTSVPSVAAPTFDPVSGTEFGDEGLSVTLSCETEGASIYYTLDGSTPDNTSTLYNGAINLTTTSTINAVAYDGTDYSNVTTATYTYVDPNAPGTVNNPYTVAQAIANTPSTGNVYIRGIVSSFYNTSITGDGSNYRYYISDDGSTTTQLIVY
ncbi:MAG: chitobiase/beta-hexosaminidase C-terminal domain-containing protein, partial [Bacteroidales bacterium]|nr:chitobiase/beta-hexosaminidase C-terminal domain-containing protein [Bacteroidales bacterium]